jgi:ABC-type spermidine/putrescine transport system permease subunit I
MNGCSNKIFDQSEGVVLQAMGHQVKPLPLIHFDKRGLFMQTKDLIKAQIFEKPVFFKYGLLLPVFIYLGVLFIYPLLKMFLTSCFDPDFTLKHFIHMYKNPVYLKVIVSTLQLGFICTIFSLILGYPLAYLLYSVKPGVRNLLFILILLPFWTSLLVRTYAWMVILGRFGVINWFVNAIGLSSTPIPLLYNTFSVTIGMVHWLLPFMVFPIYSVMSGIDKDLTNAAYNLGATPVKAFIKVFFPLSLPGVGAGSLIVFILAIGFFVTPAILGGRKNTVISMLIENQVTVQFNWPFAAAVALVLVAMTMALFIFANRFLGIDRIWGRKL